MIIVGVVAAAFTGSLNPLTNAAVSSAQDAVSLCVKMLGIIAMWSGMMKIAEDSGLVPALAGKMSPLLRFLFPNLPPGGPAVKYISANFIANILGIGWAATPAGLKAMEELQKLNPRKDAATKSMCMFLIFNMSSLQLVSVNIIAYRAECGSKNPAEIIGAGLLATLVSTAAAVLCAKIFEALAPEERS
jgi:spore maturation protein A